MAAQGWTLLAKALRSLSNDELAVVLDEVMAPDAGRLLFLESHGMSPNLPTLFRSRRAEAGAPEPMLVGFLLRLPPARHAALKSWCETNGYSMAVVVRGLVERFLDERDAT